ncbi:MAG: type II toxin-antitoxin system HicA family toxin [Candidatus Aegiribacteria sp.]|nr:type II toxin-antitoxin system HicA family toxin [Candidatus Aegiribacteria sp.]
MPSDFTWSEFSKMMRHFGYKETSKSGARRKFYNEDTEHMLSIDEPHCGDAIRKFDLRRVRKNLKEQGLFNDD